MSSYSPEGPDAEAVTASGPSLYDLVTAVVAGYLRDGEAEIRRAIGGDGTVVVSVRISVNHGAVERSRGQVSFERVRHYGG